MTRDLFGLVGQTVGGKFRVERVLGEGGFGVVYAGTHLLLGVPVAIKCMKAPGYTPEDAERGAQAFLREAKILYELTHPAIVRIYEIGILSGSPVPYAVLELLSGTTLASEIEARAGARRHFTRDELIAIFAPILEGVAFAHERGVVHRDLKPSNLMLVAEGSRFTPKVLDFGTARRDEPAPGAASMAFEPSKTGFTPLYAAPEQWDGSFGAVGPRSDVFALGLTIAEACLLGYPLARGEGMLSVLRALVDEGARPGISDARPDLPPELERTLLRALRVRAGERYADARELLVAFRAALRAAPTTAPLARPIAPPLPLAPTVATGPGSTPSASSHPVLARMTPPPPTPAPLSPAPLTPARPTPAPLTPGPLPAIAGSAAPPGATGPPPLASVDPPPRARLPWVIAGAASIVVLASGAVIAATLLGRPAAGAVPGERTDAGEDEPAVPSPRGESPARAAAPPLAPPGAGRPPPPRAPGDGGPPARVVARSVFGSAPFWNPGEILSVARAHEAQLSACGREARAVVPGFATKVTMTVAAEADGAVSNVMCGLSDDEPGEAELCTCTVVAIGSWRFPPAHGRVGGLTSGTFFLDLELVP